MSAEEDRSTLHAGPTDDSERYELHRVHSRGGEGELWEGSLALDGVTIPVAIKILHPGSQPPDGGDVARWRHQAELLRTLAHPNVVTVREVFEGPPAHDAGAPLPSGRAVYLVMNWVDGEPADRWVATRPERTASESIAAIQQLADAVDYLHSGVSTSRPVLHRDIKPGNLIVDDDGSACLVDFGLARLLQHEPLTIAGTPAYLAPEIMTGQAFTEATDRFAFGATAAYLLTGQVPDPIGRDRLKDALSRVPTGDGEADLSRPVLAMLDPDPDSRPASCGEVVRELTAALTEPADPASVTPVRPTPPVSPASDGLSDRRSEAAPPSPPHARSRHRRRLFLAGLLTSWLLFAASGVYLADAMGLSFGGGDNTEAPGDGDGNTGDGQDGGAETATTEGDSGQDAEDAQSQAAMPGLIGETLADARAILEEIGVSDVSVEEEDSGEVPGTVLGQRPSPSATLDDEVLLLVAAVPDALPDVVGRPLDDALEFLGALGIDATVTEVLDEELADRTVVQQQPEPHAPFRPEMELVVARRGLGRFLTEVSPVSGGVYESGVATVDGQEYARSLMQWLASSRSESEQVGFDLGRRFEGLTATVGLLDSSGSDARVRFEILGDGTVLHEATLGLGESENLDLDVSSVLRLELIATRLSDRDSRPVAVFADPRVVGLPDRVPDLDEG